MPPQHRIEGPGLEGRRGLCYRCRPSRINSILHPTRWGFCYKNQYLEEIMERLALHTRWVNHNGTEFGLNLTAA